MLWLLHTNSLRGLYRLALSASALLQFESETVNKDGIQLR